MSTTRSRGKWGGAILWPTTWIVISIVLVMGALSPVAPALPRGIEPTVEPVLVNHDFQAGLYGWQVRGGVAAAPAPDGRKSARAVLVSGGPVSSLTQSVAVGRPGDILGPLPKDGERGLALEGLVRLWLGEDMSTGEVGLLLHSVSTQGRTPVASARLDLGSLPRGVWINLRSIGIPRLDGRLQSDTTHIGFELKCSGRGTLWVDGARLGVRTRAGYPLLETDFEGSGAVPTAWGVQGAVQVSGSTTWAAPYYGSGMVLLDGPTRITQGFDLSLQSDHPALGDRPEVGLWLYLRGDVALPPRADPNQWFDVLVLARTTQAGRPDVEVARLRFHPTADQVGRWMYLETESQGLLPAASQVEVQVIKNFPGQAALDFIQVGQAGYADGNPPRLVTAGYVGWYRSPLAVESVASPTDPRAIWGNWAWTTPPYGDPNNNSLAHNPDCNTSPNCLRSTGRRDGAVGVIDGPGFLPLAGTYDSRDEDVLRLHVEQAHAIGLHSFVFDWLGHALDQQTALPGESTPNAGALEGLFDAAESGPSDLKIGLLLEPKVHMLGWVAGQPSFDDRKQGIAADLIWYLRRYGSRRALWRREGRPVVFIFEPGICMPSGPCLQDDDWQDISAWVTAATGEVPELIAGQPPAVGAQAFAGAMRWRLLGPPILRFGSYTDFVLGIERSPSLADVEAFSRGVDQEASDWAALDAARYSVAMAWPGFDDSGVAGWGQPNGVGSDGLPLAVRVCGPQLSSRPGAFLAATGRGLQRSEANWLHLATWNDWNESTALEASYSQAYVDALRQGRVPSLRSEQDVLGRLRAARGLVQGWLSKAGEQTPQANELESITRRYVRATLTGSVVAYD